MTYRRFVMHHRVRDYELLGWVLVGPAGGNHSHWSVIMKWTGEGEPREP